MASIASLEKTKERNKKLTMIETKKDENLTKNEEKCFYLHLDDHPDLKTKWTDPIFGKVLDGGWTCEAIERFSLFRKHCQKNRLTETGKEWEKRQWMCCKKNMALRSQIMLCSREKIR